MPSLLYFTSCLSLPIVTNSRTNKVESSLTDSHTGYTAQVLGDALTYADHAGRSGSVQMEDVTLAIQSRVGWEFGGRVPKEVRTRLRLCHRT